MKVEIYVGRQEGDTYSPEFQRLKLYPDDKISLTIKNVDINNISKNYSDFTQSFKIPADDPTNSAVFKYYYNIDNDYQFNANIRVAARIDINSIPFRVGKIQLENVGMKNGEPEYYTVTFYSNLINLKDKFGDDLLSTLGTRKSDGLPVTILSDNDFPYNEGEILPRIESAQYNDDVIFPLIGLDRFWTFDDNADSGIKYESGTLQAIKKEEIRPSINVSRIIQAIEERYELDFGENFVNSYIPNSLYLWLNKNEIKDINIPVDIPLQNPLVITYQNPGFPLKNDRMYLDGNFFVITINKYTNISAVEDFGIVDYTITPSSGDTAVTYNASIVDENDNVLSTINNVIGTQTISAQKKSTFLVQGDQSTTVDFKTRLIVQSNFELEVTVDVLGTYKQKAASVTYIYETATVSGNTTIVDGNFSILRNLPDMTVSDFFISLMKMYNLAIIPDELIENKFNVISLTEYYEQGKTNVVDLTEYIDIDKHTISRKNFYKELKFIHQKNDMYINQEYLTNFGRNFGDETFKLPNADGTGESYLVESKFKIAKAGLLSIYPIAFGFNSSIDKQLNTPVLFAYGGQVDSVDSSGTETDDRFGFLTYAVGGAPVAVPIDSVPYLSTDIVLDGEYRESITFSVESDYLGELKDITLYSKYYASYIAQIYSLKTREFSYTINVPPNILYKLYFNTVVIVGDYKFNITEMTIDLTTGAGTIKLLNQLNNGLY